jgi:hypothetical protein
MGCFARSPELPNPLSRLGCQFANKASFETAISDDEYEMMARRQLRLGSSENVGPLLRSDEILVSKLPDLCSDPGETLARIDEHQALRAEIA